MAKYRIVIDFGGSEVRRKSEKTLAPFFREWETVPEDFITPRPSWKGLRRREAACGYPRLDILNDWLMDFASISAYQMGRPDWKNFRRLLLLHVPDCPFFCWYCFNDAWPPSDTAGEQNRPHHRPVVIGEETTSAIVEKFEEYRRNFEKSDGRQVNVLRLSGGEPFTQPELVADLASEFGGTFRDQDPAFLWVDTNLFPLASESAANKKALEALKALGPRAAVHACLHGANDDSLQRNTGNPKAKFKQLLAGLASLLESELHVYPRGNPAGLTVPETQELFQELFSVASDLPARTYLGPVELHYEAASDRIRIFGGSDALFDPAVKRPRTEHAGRVAPLQPPNASIFAWNRLMETTYGCGYAVVPRQCASQLRVLRAPSDGSIPVLDREWTPLVLVAKGWEKEVYNLKLLELLGLPEGCQIDVEYENNWVEPTFVGHAFAAPTYYAGKPVLFVAAQKRWPLPVIIPLRWGTVDSVTTAKVDERYSLNARIIVDKYAVDLAETFEPSAEGNFSAALAKYIGVAKLPFQGAGGYFCQFASLPLKDAGGGEERPDDFKSVVLQLVESAYDAAKNDIYYRVADISRVLPANGQPAESVQLTKGRLELYEGDDLAVTIEACNPNLGDSGYPVARDAEIAITSTDPGSVLIAPDTLRLSKYGKQEVHLRFPRKGEFSGMILVRPCSTALRMAELQIPFQLNIRSDEDA